MESKKGGYISQRFFKEHSSYSQVVVLFDVSFLPAIRVFTVPKEIKKKRVHFETFFSNNIPTIPKLSCSLMFFSEQSKCSKSQPLFHFFQFPTVHAAVLGKGDPSCSIAVWPWNRNRWCWVWPISHRSQPCSNWFLQLCGATPYLSSLIQFWLAIHAAKNTMDLPLPLTEMSMIFFATADPTNLHPERYNPLVVLQHMTENCQRSMLNQVLLALNMVRDLQISFDCFPNPGEDLYCVAWCSIFQSLSWSTLRPFWSKPITILSALHPLAPMMTSKMTMKMAIKKASWKSSPLLWTILDPPGLRTSLDPLGLEKIRMNEGCRCNLELFFSGSENQTIIYFL